MARPDLAELRAFVLIAKLRSFRKAADELGMSPSTLSHLMRALERDIGVRLLHRTTRSVSATQAGESLVSRLEPVLRDLERALQEVDAVRGSPSGILRINASEPAARRLLRSVVPTFAKRYPEVTLDLVTENRLVDIVALGFDAGLRLGEAVPQDMVAVRCGGPLRFLAVASPRYLTARGVPTAPEDLQQHDCVRIRMPSGTPYRWELSRDGRELSVEVPGRLILDHVGLMTEAALDDLGIAYVPEDSARAHLDAGRLVTVLEDWCPPIPGLFLYYPGHRHVPPALRAFIDVLKETLP
jgi:DNA-binding transcriptional LysR family regulator